MDSPSPFRARNQHEEVSESWLMSYADMITLLLCFFVIFVSTSEPKEDQLAAATRGMKSRFGTVDLTTPFQGAFRDIQGVIDKNEAALAMSVEKTEKGLLIEMSSSTYYAPNSAELKPEQIPMLVEMIQGLDADIFRQYNIIVEGHTDDSEPKEGGLYPTNWELSSARASRMVRFFLENGFDPKRLKAVGLASSQPKVPNLDKQGQPIEANRERNRRVVVKLERNW
jgi:chemotaxis protein MotB